MKKLYFLMSWITLTTYAQINPGAGVTDASGNGYETVVIGNLEWMKGNLRTTKKCGGTNIPEGNGVTWGSNTSMYMQSNNTAINSIYRGLLYNWLATQNSQNACPCGWRVPTNADWTYLKDFLISNGYNYDGSTTDNKIAKSLAFNFWWDTSTAIGAVGNNLDLNNSSTFSALPAGSISNSGNYGLLNQTHWWSSTASSYDYFSISSSGISLTNTSSTSLDARYYGRSIRCVKNATLSTNDYNKSKANIYPNPIKTDFKIETTETVNSIEIFDLVGKKVLSKNNISDAINIEFLPKGMYLLKIYTDSGIFNSKIIKD